MLTPFTLATALLVPLGAPALCLDGPLPVLAAGPDAAALSAHPSDGSAQRPGDDALRDLYGSGTAYDDFLAAADRRAELWHANTDRAEGIDMALVERARAVGGTWRFLAVAIAACSDSVSTIPYLAELVSLVDGLEMRIVDNQAGRSVMEGHRTPDGRPATPTVLLLDQDWEEAGCFIERPPSLQTWILENDEGLSAEDIFQRKMAWYAEDAGQETLESIVEMLEAAAGGASICR